MMTTFATAPPETGPIATDYDGPTREASFRFGDSEVRILLPSDPDRLLNDPKVLALNRDHDYMPYWAYLWPGAFLLAEAIAGESWPEGTRALELGCGLGLAGLVGLTRGLDVEFTDYDPAPFRFIEASLRLNRVPDGRGATRLLDWRDPGSGRFPVILGADLLYETRLIPLVGSVLASCLEPGGQALVGGPYRVATEGLDAELRTRGLVATATDVEARMEAGPTVRGTIHRIRHRT